MNLVESEYIIWHNNTKAQPDAIGDITNQKTLQCVTNSCKY